MNTNILCSVKSKYNSTYADDIIEENHCITIKPLLMPYFCILKLNYKSSVHYKDVTAIVITQLK